MNELSQIWIGQKCLSSKFYDLKLFDKTVRQIMLNNSKCGKVRVKIIFLKEMR
jgi:hypothetical protein